VNVASSAKSELQSDANVSGKPCVARRMPLSAASERLQRLHEQCGAHRAILMLFLACANPRQRVAEYVARPTRSRFVILNFCAETGGAVFRRAILTPVWSAPLSVDSVMLRF
jgi:hypothetical protein